MSWGSLVLHQPCPARVPSPPSSRDDVIGKVCLTRDTLAAHPKGKTPGGRPCRLLVPCPPPHWSAQSPAHPPLRDLPLGSFSPLCSGKPSWPPQKGPWPSPSPVPWSLPCSWDHSAPLVGTTPRGDEGLLVRSEISARRGRGLFMLRCQGVGSPHPSLAGCVLHWVSSAWSPVSSVEGVGLGQGVAREPLEDSGDTDIVWRGQPCPSLAV